MLHRLTTVLVLLVLGGAGCILTPIPEPPNLDPPDLDKMYSAAEISVISTEIELLGDSGAAEPGSTLWVVNLEVQEPPVTTVVEGDGSFFVAFPATEGDEARIQLRADEGRRSTPIDATLWGVGPPQRVDRQACLELEPTHEVDLGTVERGSSASATVEIRNQCDAEVTIDALRLRAPAPAFVVETPAPVAVPAGGSAEVRLRFAPADAGLEEEILFLEVTSPFAERRPLTLYGTGR